MRRPILSWALRSASARPDRKSADASPHGATDSSFSTSGRFRRKLTLNYGIRYELPTVPYTINGNASFLNADQSALIVAHARDALHQAAAQGLGAARRLRLPHQREDDVPRRRGIYYNPNQTNSYTFLNTNPPFTTILNCNWSSGLPTTQPVESARCRRDVSCFRAARSAGLDRHSSVRSAHAAHESVERRASIASSGMAAAWSCSISDPIPITSTAASTTTRRCRDPVRSTAAGRTRSSAVPSAPSPTT